MKILKTEFLIQKGSFALSSELETILEQVRNAIRSVTWPQGSDRFILYPVKMANGVVPIKKNCMCYLVREGWTIEYRMSIASRLKPGPIDAVKKLIDGRWFAVEWETGNISSSHRALNKMAVGLLDGKLAGGVLILPSREMYRYLTDRIGNYAEIEPYFPVWKNLSIRDGVLAVIEIEHDDLSLDVPPIIKGTDGRALR
ncbi:MAG: restriction endonuclease [Deltaproteobacteria bacterium]|nr:restriction endonuclease [Deltaproteobacteria bacterium]